MGDLGEAFAENARRQRPSHPKGWEPHVEERGDGTATAISQPTEQTDPQEGWLLLGWGMDPLEWRIVGKVNVRRWQTYDERWLYYYKADLVRRDHSNLDVDAFCSRVLKRKPRISERAEGTAALVVCWADWQVGKSDGDGLDGTRDRLADMVGKVEDRWRDLRKLRVPLSSLHVLGMGDLGEACGSHYAQQGFRTVLNIRDQRKVIRWGIDSALDRWARLIPLIAVKAVGGNHGEERMDGKSYTDFGDNRDVAVFEDVSFAYRKNDERYGHVSFSLPNDDLTLTYDHEGLIVGLAHGHQAGFGAGDPRAKIDKWWRGQMAGQQPIGDADILITGHYHHPWMVRLGTRTHFGCPSLEGGSDWYRNTCGVESPPGTLTFVVDPTGWSRMEIL